MKKALVLTLLAFLVTACGKPAAGPATQPAPPPASPAAPAAPKAAAPSQAPKAAAAAPAQAPKKPTTNEEIFLYNGPDRQEILKAGAAKEGVVNWYTSDFVGVADQAVKDFQAMYPGIKVNMFRGGADEVRTKILAEAKARQAGADVASVNIEGAIPVIDIKGLTGEFYSPAAAKIHKKVVFPNAQRSLWVGKDYAVHSLTYNTNLIKGLPDAIDYEDLADPRWKGKLGLDERNWDFYAMLFQHFGEARAQRIVSGWAQQGPLLRRGAALLAQLTAAGEIGFVPNMYLQIAVREKGRGAPLDWKLYKSSNFATPRLVFPMSGTKSPHATMLFIDYLLGPMQKLMADQGEVPAIPEMQNIIKPAEFEKFVVVDPDDMMNNSKKYQDFWNKVILKK